MKKICLCICFMIILSGCATTLQRKIIKQVEIAGEIYEVEEWQDVARIKGGQGSFDVEWDEEGRMRKLKSDSKKSSLIERGADIYTLREVK